MKKRGLWSEGWPVVYIVESRPAQDTQQYPSAWSFVWEGGSLDEARRRARAEHEKQWTDVQIRVEP